MHLTLPNIWLPPPLHSPAKRSRQSRIFKPEVRSLDVQSRLAQSRRQFHFKAPHFHVWRRAYAAASAPRRRAYSESVISFWSADVRSCVLSGSMMIPASPDRKSTRLNSSHLGISYAV